MLGAILGGLGAGLVGGLINRSTQKATNKSNENLQADANEASAALWREQSAYNTPEAQMARLKEAGLSPQLAYGQIADSKASTPPQMQAAVKKAPRLDLLAAHQQIVNMQENNRLTRQNTAIAKAQAITAHEQAKYAAYKNKTLMEAGLLETDPMVGRLLGRGTDVILKSLNRLSDFALKDSERYKMQHKGGKY